MDVSIEEEAKRVLFQGELRALNKRTDTPVWCGIHYGEVYRVTRYIAHTPYYFMADFETFEDAKNQIREWFAEATDKLEQWMAEGKEWYDKHPEYLLDEEEHRNTCYTARLQELGFLVRNLKLD